MNWIQYKQFIDILKSDKIQTSLSNVKSGELHFSKTRTTIRIGFRCLKFTPKRCDQ